MDPQAVLKKGWLPAYIDPEETLFNSHQPEELGDLGFASNSIVPVNDEFQKRREWFNEYYESNTQTVFCPAAAHIPASGDVKILKNETGCSYLHLVVPQTQVSLFEERGGHYFGAEGMQVEDE